MILWNRKNHNNFFTKIYPYNNRRLSILIIKSKNSYCIAFYEHLIFYLLFFIFFHHVSPFFLLNNHFFFKMSITITKLRSWIVESQQLALSWIQIDVMGEKFVQFSNSGFKKSNNQQKRFIMACNVVIYQEKKSSGSNLTH